MPSTEVRAFQDDDGTIPIQDWLENLECTQPKAHAKALAFILELANKGYELRRPHADTLRDGIHELRPSFRGIQYRVLYFFFGRNAVALSHGIAKEGEVPSEDIDLAIARMNLVKRWPDKYTATFEL